MSEKTAKTSPLISIVIPVHNEEEVLASLWQRLTKVMDKLAKPYEIIFTNDGSQDKSAAILEGFFRTRPEQVQIVHFNGNFGQHQAIMAGFEQVQGEMVLTMDADLQNPPEDIPKLVAEMEKGHDVVGAYRVDRQDKRWRLWVSNLHNKVRSLIIPGLKMKDEGCMLRAYRRNIVDCMVQSAEASTFIPALALTFAENPSEVPISHAPREAGTSSYNLYGLIRYNFDLVTGFSLVPLQLFTIIGLLIAFCSGLLVIYLGIRRVFIGPEADGLFTLFAILYLLVGIALTGLGIIGEYIGRIYQEVRKRPRFVIREIISNQKR